MGTWSDDVVTALESIGGSGTYEQIYDAVRRIRPHPMPPSWRQIVQRRIQDLSSDSAGFKENADLFFSVSGIGGGVWGLRRAARATPVAVDISEGSVSPMRELQSTYRVLRDTLLARQIKLLHRNRCQICGLALEGARGETYAEAHHIIPLGQPYNGSDVAENILVVCPNHHAQCDLGAIELEEHVLRKVPGHAVSSASLAFHNTHIYAGLRS